MIRIVLGILQICAGCSSVGDYVSEGTEPGFRLRGASVGYRGDRLLLTDVISTPCVSAGMKGTSSTQFGGCRHDSLPVSF
jgi:hypothetical protein